jgi:DNA-directed RNA polymerase specialized sigma24 family protein
MLNNLYKADEDSRLAIAIQAGDGQSYSLLYDKYAPALLGIIIKMIEDKDRAEKTLQLAFQNAWDRISGFNPVACSLFTWLIHIARNTALEEIRSTQTINSPGKNYVHEATYPHISGLETTAAVFELVYNKGMTCTEVATLLGISTDEVKINIKKAVQSLRDKIVIC